MNLKQLVFGVWLLGLVEDVVVHGKRNAKTVTFSRTPRGYWRRKRDTWTSGQALFTACKSPLSPKDHELLLDHTHEVGRRHLDKLNNYDHLTIR